LSRPPFSVNNASSLFITEEEKKIMAHCPECDAQVSVQGLLIGEIIYCSDCNAELEVVNVEQPEVTLAPQVEEDWGE
jgi:alpha-aminoadipate/glutamate carrier protein LysW